MESNRNNNPNNFLFSGANNQYSNQNTQGQQEGYAAHQNAIDDEEEDDSLGALRREPSEIAGSMIQANEQYDYP
jgi:hypothetical protein